MENEDGNIARWIFIVICLIQALEAEIVAHEKLIEDVNNAAHHMVEKKHYASSDIQNKIEELLGQLHELKSLSATRRQKLTDAVEAQMVRYNQMP